MKKVTRILPWLVALFVAIVAFMTTRMLFQDAANIAASPAAADPLQRVQACQSASVAQLVVLASDTDWRVRTAAFAALDRRAPVASMPMRDTPMVQRERILLDWLRENQPQLLKDLCEVHAHSPFAEYNTVLVDQCLRCHVGREPTPQLASERCDACHHDIHEQWITTAHAQSLAHLTLRTIDPTTQQPAWYDFGERKGLSCVACHEPVGDHAPCLARFQTTSCATCHDDADAQWQQWVSNPHPIANTWPPGTFTYEVDPNAPSCTACHMKAGAHYWAARRDPDFLRGGIDAKIRPAGNDRWQLVLTNLSGHTYPTGTRRRAVRVYVQVGQDAEQLLAVLRPHRLEDDADTDDGQQASLAPGEQRTYLLPDTESSIRCRLVFVRDRFKDDSYVCEIASVACSPHHEPQALR